VRVTHRVGWSCRHAFLDTTDVLAVLPQNGQEMTYGREMFRQTGPCNTGVMVFDLESYRAAFPRLMQVAREHHFDFRVHDQTWIQQYHRSPLERIRPKLLPDRWNWKVYWGSPGNEATRFWILHFHGVKPFVYTSERQNMTVMRCLARMPWPGTALADCPDFLGGTMPLAAGTRAPRWAIMSQRRDPQKSFARLCLRVTQDFANQAATAAGESAAAMPLRLLDHLIV